MGGGHWQYSKVTLVPLISCISCDLLFKSYEQF
jgi:hypothetical protein